MSDLTIVMYHYVRDLERSRYPEIKARRLADFKTQLEYIAQKYNVVTANEVMAAVEGNNELPPKAAWLTFDDGYIDHYDNVFPLLSKRGWQGSFFPPARPVLEGALLDVNQIHFLLAAQRDHALLVEEIKKYVQAHPGGGLKDFADYWKELAHASRFDTVEVIFIKRMLQHVLPQPHRARLLDGLFARYVSADMAAFAAELYVSADQLKDMSRSGMYIGSHGYNHHWLDRLPAEEQAAEVDRSLEFLKQIGSKTDSWIMCYPYGAYNDLLLGILRQRNCVVGLTTNVAVARIGQDAALCLPRLDTNDISIAA